MKGGPLPHTVVALALLTAAVSWTLLLGAQAGVGPRDGPVLRYAQETELVPGVGPLVLGTGLFPGVRSGTALAVLLAVAPALLVLAVRIAGPRPAALLAIALGLASFMELPQLSNDVFLYHAAGEVVAAGANPYLVTPAEHLPPSAVRGIPWTSQPSPYGPLALGLFGLVRDTGSWLSSLWLLRAVLALPWLLAAFTLRRDPAAAALVLASPLLLLEVVQDGHVDGWVGLLLLWTVLAASKTDPRPIDRAALVIGLAAAVAIKLSAVVVVGAIAARLLRHDRWGPGRTALALLAAAAAVCVAWIPLWAGPRTFDGLSVESAKVFQSLYQVAGIRGETAAALAGAGAFLAMLAGAVAARRGASLAAACVVALVLQATLGRTFLQPWYFVPALMLAATAPRVRSSWSPWTDPAVWAVASVSLLFGGYGLVFATRSIEPAVQTASVALMILPGVVAGLIAARRSPVSRTPDGPPVAPPRAGAAGRR